MGEKMSSVYKDILRHIDVDIEDNRPSARIKAKLNEKEGLAKCPKMNRGEWEIWLTPEGVRNNRFKSLVCTWEQFDAIVEKAKELGGKMYKGDRLANTGKKIGSPEFPLDTIDAFLAIEFFGQKEGKTATRRSTYYAAIMAWAGICKNYSSAGTGLGGYIELIGENQLKNSASTAPAAKRKFQRHYDSLEDFKKILKKDNVLEEDKLHIVTRSYTIVEELIKEFLKYYQLIPQNDSYTNLKMLNDAGLFEETPTLFTWLNAVRRIRNECIHSMEAAKKLTLKDLDTVINTIGQFADLAEELLL